MTFRSRQAPGLNQIEVVAEIIEIIRGCEADRCLEEFICLRENAAFTGLTLVIVDQNNDREFHRAIFVILENGGVVMRDKAGDLSAASAQF